MCALYLNRFQFTLIDLDVLALAELIAAPFMRGIDGAARLLVDHLLTQPVPGLRVDLVKMCPLFVVSFRTVKDQV